MAPRLDSAFFDISALDTLAAQDSAIHRLDPRAKLITTLAFVVTVISFDRYEISGLLMFLVFPTALVALAGLPLGPLLKRLVLVAPFALLVGIFNPLFDREVLVRIGPLAISGGWISFGSIVLRFFLTVSAALILIATSGFLSVCVALERLKVPKAFVVQLLFLYRYLFVLVAEAARLARARALRSFDGRGLGMRVVANLIGHLLLRTLARAQRIHLAMLCRGFDGEIRLDRALVLRRGDLLYVAGWLLAFVLMRNYNLPQLLGDLTATVLS